MGLALGCLLAVLSGVWSPQAQAQARTAAKAAGGGSPYEEIPFTQSAMHSGAIELGGVWVANYGGNEISASNQWWPCEHSDLGPLRADDGEPILGFVAYARPFMGVSDRHGGWTPSGPADYGQQMEITFNFAALDPTATYEVWLQYGGSDLPPPKTRTVFTPAYGIGTRAYPSECEYVDADHHTESQTASAALLSPSAPRLSPGYFLGDPSSRSVVPGVYGRDVEVATSRPTPGGALSVMIVSHLDPSRMERAYDGHGYDTWPDPPGYIGPDDRLITPHTVTPIRAWVQRVDHNEGVCLQEAEPEGTSGMEVVPTTHCDASGSTASALVANPVKIPACTDSYLVNTPATAVWPFSSSTYTARGVWNATGLKPGGRYSVQLNNPDPSCNVTYNQSSVHATVNGKAVPPWAESSPRPVIPLGVATANGSGQIAVTMAASIQAGKPGFSPAFPLPVSMSVIPETPQTTNGAKGTSCDEQILAEPPRGETVLAAGCNMTSSPANRISYSPTCDYSYLDMPSLSLFGHGDGSLSATEDFTFANLDPGTTYQFSIHNADNSGDCAAGYDMTTTTPFNGGSDLRARLTPAGQTTKPWSEVGCGGGDASTPSGVPPGEVPEPAPVPAPPEVVPIPAVVAGVARAAVAANCPSLPIDYVVGSARPDAQGRVTLTISGVETSGFPRTTTHFPLPVSATAVPQPVAAALAGTSALSLLVTGRPIDEPPTPVVVRPTGTRPLPGRITNLEPLGQAAPAATTRPVYEPPTPVVVRPTGTRPLPGRITILEPPGPPPATTTTTTTSAFTRPRRGPY